MAGFDDGYGQQQGTPQFSFPPLTPWVKRLLIANLAVFLIVFAIGFAGPEPQEAVTRFLGVDPESWRSFIPAVWEFVTYAFVHDPRGLGHLLGNSLMLYFFGTMVETAIGPRRFITHYLIAAVIGGVLHLVVTLLSGSMSYAVGASGAVMGVVVTAAVMNPHATVWFILVPIKLWVLAAILVAIDLFAILASYQPGAVGDNVAHWVHLGGVVYGYLAAKRRWIYKDPLVVIERKRAVAQEQKRISDDARVDQLLAKIQREGLGNLTRAERAFLKKSSERRPKP